MLSCMINSCRYNWSQCCNHHHPLSFIIIYPLMASSHHRLSSYSTYINTSHHHHLVAAYYLWSTAVIIVKAHFNCLSKVSLHHSSLTLRQAVSRRGMLAAVNSFSAVPRQEYKLFYRLCLIRQAEQIISKFFYKLDRPNFGRLPPEPWYKYSTKFWNFQICPDIMLGSKPIKAQIPQ